MGIFRQLFSTDLRAARAAEAAGDPDTAATHYGLAGDRAGAVRMHLARAARAADRAAELAALHDALHWAGDDAALRMTPAARLGQLMLAAARAEGIVTARVLFDMMVNNTTEPTITADQIQAEMVKAYGEQKWMPVQALPPEGFSGKWFGVQTFGVPEDLPVDQPGHWASE